MATAAAAVCGNKRAERQWVGGATADEWAGPLSDPLMSFEWLWLLHYTLLLLQLPCDEREKDEVRDADAGPLEDHTSNPAPMTDEAWYATGVTNNMVSAHIKPPKSFFRLTCTLLRPLK